MVEYGSIQMMSDTASAFPKDPLTTKIVQSTFSFLFFTILSRSITRPQCWAVFLFFLIGVHPTLVFNKASEIRESDLTQSRVRADVRWKMVCPATAQHTSEPRYPLTTKVVRSILSFLLYYVDRLSDCSFAQSSSSNYLRVSGIQCDSTQSPKPGLPWKNILKRWVAVHRRAAHCHT